MIEFEAARRNFVDSQIRVNDVTDPRLIAALRAAPREKFAPRNLRALAYAEGDLEIAPGRFLLDGRDFSKLADALDVQPGEVVLDIGCATGYSTLILAALAETVVAVECDEALAESATKTLNELDVGNAVVINGALPEGAPGQGPFDAILVSGGVEIEPTQLLKQLKPGGRLVAIVNHGPAGRAQLYERAGDAFGTRELFDAKAPTLPGFEAKPCFEF